MPAEPLAAGPSLETERQVAIDAVRAAALVCRDVREAFTDGDASSKADRSPVTVADLASQAIIAAALADAFAPDPLVGEEDAGLLRADVNGRIAEAVFRFAAGVRPDLDPDRIMAAIDRGDGVGGAIGRFWTLDPVDGTKGFLRNEQYAVALALVEDGEVRLGVLGCPNLPVELDDPDGRRGCLFVAERGGGAWMSPMTDGAERTIEVRRPEAIQDARWVASVEAAHSALDEAAAVTALLGIRGGPRRMDSQAKYGMVARGDAAIYLRLPTNAMYQERIWDHAAGWLLVTEAGGRVTDVDGREIDFGRGRTLAANRGVIATSGGDLHDRVLDAVARMAES